MPRLAITGGIAEGKSTVLECLREAGYLTASSDEISRELFATDPVQRGLSALLGLPAPVHPEDLRAQLFDNPTLRREVNRLMHPLIIRAILASRADAIEIPLLVETCLQGRFERVWVVTCGPQEQRRRLIERIGDESRVDTILASQLATEVKVAFADAVVRTNRPREDVQRFVAAMASRSLS